MLGDEVKSPKRIGVLDQLLIWIELYEVTERIKARKRSKSVLLRRVEGFKFEVSD